MGTRQGGRTSGRTSRVGPPLAASGLAVILVAACLVTASRPAAAPAAECPARGPKHADCGVHNMMVVGERTIFLSHLPMFDGEHRFQVILEATLSKGGTDLDGAYASDRRSHPGVTMYTLSPRDEFVLAALFATDPARRRSFRGTVFRGHLERGGVQLETLTDVDVTVRRVVHAEEIGARSGARSDTLDYILFGKGAELFLAHRIALPPDFDQLLRVKVSGHTFADEDLGRGVSVKIPGRENAPARRLRAAETVAAQGRVAGAQTSPPLTVGVAAELYFEEGELASPATFRQTPLEKEAGF